MPWLVHCDVFLNLALRLLNKGLNMKLVRFVILLLIISQSVWAAESYQLDKDHTYVTWQVSHFGFSDVSGKFMADGTLIFDKSKPENSSVNVVIHTDQPATGVTKLDDILK